MCCFSGPVRAVSATSIFARSEPDGRQALVYAMRLDAERELAMVLPLPVAPGTGEDGVRFVDLSGYEGFFADLHRAWPQPRSKETAGVATPAAAPAPAPLQVVEVGAYEASFVPTVADFSRLDERFRLPAGTWDQLPLYRAHGFAVFKLKPGRRTVHPMAFSFPRADRRALFFPTVHIHDGTVRLKARFDHRLYAQLAPGDAVALAGWQESPELLGRHVDIARAKGLVDAEGHGHLLELQGLLDNRDTVLRPA
jgi:hypothetical protein